MHYKSLNAEKALIWRIVHRDNLEWILKNGLHCANSTILDPGYINIGNSDLISKRDRRVVPVSPGGTLADYVPFYFTPFSVMMMNIHSGRGVRQRDNDEIVILVSSLHQIKSLGIEFLFTNGHAYPSWTQYYSELDDLHEIDWPLLQRRDFKRDIDDPRKLERYQAEALVHEHLPIEGLVGVICFTDEVKKIISAQIDSEGLTLPIHARKDWYFQ